MKYSTPQTDCELIRLFRNGDQKALEQLILRYKDKIYTSILLMVKDRHLAEDFFQEVFIKVIGTLRGGRYNEEGKFLPWVIRIAHNHCLDHFRRCKNNPGLKAGRNDEYIIENSKHSEQAVEAKIMKRESLEKVRRMLDLLPENQREVIVLRHFAELSFKEIAHLTNASINTTLGRMRYGLINLRKIMQGEPVTV